MNIHDLDLKPGDIVTHVSTGNAFQVISKTEHGYKVERVLEIMNPTEWKVTYRQSEGSEA